MKPHHHDNQQAAADAEHAIDPVCGMTVDRDKAVTAQVEGRAVFFCSPGCRDAFTG